MIDQSNISNANTSPDDENFLSALDLEKIWEILRKSIIWMLLFPMLTLGIAHLWLRYTKPLYKSSSTLKLTVKDEGVGMLGIKGIFSRGNTGANLVGEIEFIRSQIIFNDVINVMDLWVSYYQQGNILDAEYYKNAPFKVINHKVKSDAFLDKNINITILDKKRFKLSYELGSQLIQHTYNFNQKINTAHYSFEIVKTSFYKPIYQQIPFYFKINSRQALINYLNNNLRVGILNKTARIIGVNFSDHRPRKAQDIVQVIDTIYLHKTLESKKRANTQQKAYLNRRLGEIEDSMRTYEAKIQGFMLKFKTNDVNKKLAASVKEIETLIKEKIVLNEQLAAIRELNDLINKEETLTEFLPILSTPISGLTQLPQLIDGLNELQKKKKLLSLKVTSSSIIFKDLNKQLEIQRTQIQKLIDRVRKGLYKKIVDIQSKINELEAAFGGLPAQEAEYKRIERLYKIYEGYYLQMLNRKAEIGISEAGIVPEFVILSQANLPKIPISPRRLLIYGIAGGFGVFLSFALVIIRYLLHNKVTNLRELERVTKAPILGTVPKYKHRKLKYTKLLVHINPKSSLNEALRSIRTNLAFILPQGQNLYDATDTKIISITSTISGEGKTFVATNLGGIIAMSEKKVILLDCDMRKPKLHIAFDVENDVGVSNVLIKQNTLEDCIKKTPIDTLDFISAGPTPPNPSELILRSDFDDLLAKLKENYDIIIIDTPPVGLVTDGVLIMKKVDVPLYVVKAHYSRKVFGKGIDKLVQSNNFHNLSIVLNSVKHMTGYGGYKYGYGYGKYYGGGYYEDKSSQQSLLLRLLSIFKRKK